MEIHTPEQLNQQLKDWSPILKEDPLWYQKIMPVLLRWEQHVIAGKPAPKMLNIVYGFFREQLEKGEIFLAENGPVLDQWRKPIDTAVIHYTAGEPGVTWQQLSAIGLLRQYAHDYYKYDNQYGIYTKDQPIWSGHFREEKQVFYAYHWLVRLNGEYERLLDDTYIGWQAGNKDINFRSIGIVLDGTFVDSEPPIEAIKGISNILNQYYPQITKENVFGHREVTKLLTLCPGNLFVDGWKNKLLEKLQH